MAVMWWKRGSFLFDCLQLHIFPLWILFAMTWHSRLTHIFCSQILFAMMWHSRLTPICRQRIYRGPTDRYIRLYCLTRSTDRCMVVWMVLVVQRCIYIYQWVLCRGARGASVWTLFASERCIWKTVFHREGLNPLLSLILWVPLCEILFFEHIFRSRTMFTCGTPLSLRNSVQCLHLGVSTSNLQ